MQTIELLRVAMYALRDLDAGYPPSELGRPAGAVDELIPDHSPLDKLIGTIALHLARVGELDDDDRSMVEGQIPDLEIPATVSAGRGRQAMLAELVNEGLLLGEALEPFQSEDDDPFVRAARERFEHGSDGDVVIDPNAPISESDDGAYVLGWLWVTNEAAGIDDDDGDDGDGEDDENLRQIPNPHADKSISDDDLCARCRHCTYRPGEQSSCAQSWPGQINGEDQVVACGQFVF